MGYSKLSLNAKTFSRFAEITVPISAFIWGGCSDGGRALDCKSSTLETPGVRIPPTPLQICLLAKEV